jgi:ornithine cyclodeaminase/alanine dehydrogenase-like protein (mu-crystallin family)
MSTLLLTRSDVEQLLDPEALVEPLRAGFVAYSAGPPNRALRVRAALDPGAGTATVLFPGTVPALPAYTVKVHAKFPGQMPAIRGVLCLHDVNAGALLTVMDSTYLTAVRTGIAGGPRAGTPRRHERGRGRRRRPGNVPAAGAESHADGSERMGVRPRAGSRRRVCGADGRRAWRADSAVELGGGRSTARRHRADGDVGDDRALAVELGALRGVGLGAEAAAAELGDVLAGRHPGRTSPDQITVYGGVGLAFQDAIAAWQVYEKARARGFARELDFLE